ncbi:myeloid lymphoid or mixed-lineage leukemia 5 (trithorax, ) [Nowakowskiella sp. JEL0407]|nr:myeloid lymphoid or mixed-lineage leukemia 5 (trithorax, ) [Nowakowskiella sp. JEL0407]
MKFQDEQSAEEDIEMEEEEEEVEEEDGVIRCICSYSFDDGYTIQCDLCLVWQHMTCVGYDEFTVPDTYLCEKCEPRNIDEEMIAMARSLQGRRFENARRAKERRQKEKKNGLSKGNSRNVNQKDSKKLKPKLSDWDNGSPPRKPRSYSSHKRILSGASKQQRKPRKSRWENLSPSLKNNDQFESDNDDSLSADGNQFEESDTVSEKKPYDSRTNFVYGENSVKSPGLEQTDNLLQGPIITYLRRHKHDHDHRTAHGIDLEYYKHSQPSTKATFNQFTNVEIEEAITRFVSIWDSDDTENFNNSKFETQIRVQLEELVLVPSFAFLSCPLITAIDPISTQKSTLKYGLFATTDIPQFHLIHEIKGNFCSSSDLRGRGSLKTPESEILTPKKAGICWIDKLKANLIPPFTFAHPSVFVNDKSTPRNPKFPHKLFVDSREYANRDGRFVRFYCGVNERIAENVCNATLKSVFVIEEETEYKIDLFCGGNTLKVNKRTDKYELFDPFGQRVFDNDRIRLAIFSTRIIKAQEEIIILMDKELVGYPCICGDDNPECLSSLAVEEWDSVVQEEKKNMMQAKEAEKDKMRTSNRRNSEMSIDDYDAKADGEQFSSENNTRIDRGKIDRVGAEKDDLDHESSMEVEDSPPMRPKKRRTSSVQLTEANVNIEAAMRGSLSREQRKLQEDLARISRMEQKELAKKAKKREREERERDKNHAGKKKNYKSSVDDDDQNSTNEEQKSNTPEPRDVESTDIADASFVDSTVTSALSTRANSPTVPALVIDSEVWDDTIRDDEFVVVEEGNAGVISLVSSPIEEEPKDVPKPEPVVKKVTLQDFLQRRCSQVDDSQNLHFGSHQSIGSQSEIASQPKSSTPVTEEKSIEQEKPVLFNETQTRTEGYFTTTYPASASIFSTKIRIESSPPPSNISMPKASLSTANAHSEHTPEISDPLPSVTEETSTSEIAKVTPAFTSTDSTVNNRMPENHPEKADYPPHNSTASESKSHISIYSPGRKFSQDESGRSGERNLQRSERTPPIEKNPESHRFGNQFDRQNPNDRRFYDKLAPPPERVRPDFPQSSRTPFPYQPHPLGRGRGMMPQYMRDWDRDWDRRERWERGYPPRQFRSRSPELRRSPPPMERYRRWPMEDGNRSPLRSNPLSPFRKDSNIPSSPRSPPHSHNSYNLSRRPIFDQPYDPANPDGIDFEEERRIRMQRPPMRPPPRDPYFGVNSFRDRDPERERERRERWNR